MKLLEFLPLSMLILSTLWYGAKGDNHYSVRAALLIIDVQDCFLQGGSLEVSDGNDVIPVINRIRRKYQDKFSLVALSKDWHCPGHVSFARSHPGKSVGDVIDLNYKTDGQLCLSGTVTRDNFPNAVDCSSSTTLQQNLWPVHCVQNVTSGPTSAKLAETLDVRDDDVIILKGTNCEVDSYSAFFDNGRFGQTKLDDILKSKGINTVFVTGLALDYCVFFTSMDAHSLGYTTYVVVDASRGVTENTVEDAINQMNAEGIHVINSDFIGDAVQEINGAAMSKFSYMSLVAVVFLGLTMAHLHF